MPDYLTGGQLWKGLHSKYTKLLKSALQNTLLREQGYICAYCNRPIHAGTPIDIEQMRMDHIEPKSIYRDKVFHYTNLVGSCSDNERNKLGATPPYCQHCDSSKGNTEIPSELFPTNPQCEIVWRVSRAGKIEIRPSVPNHPAIVQAVDVTLNLNAPNLCDSRKGSINGLISLVTDGDDAEIQANIAHYSTLHNGKYEPFAGIVINFLRQYV